MLDSLSVDQIKPSSTIQQTEYTILIVVDDVNIRNDIKRYLDKFNYTIVIATNGFDAIKQYVKYTPNLVILANTLQGITGYETLQYIKRLNSNAQFIMMNINKSHIPMSRKERQNIPILTIPFCSDDLCDIIDCSISLTHHRNKTKNKMVSVLLDDDVYVKIRLSQSQKIKNEKTSHSFSKTVNECLRQIL